MGRKGEDSKLHLASFLHSRALARAPAAAIIRVCTVFRSFLQFFEVNIGSYWPLPPQCDTPRARAFSLSLPPTRCTIIALARPPPPSPTHCWLYTCTCTRESASTFGCCTSRVSALFRVHIALRANRQFSRPAFTARQVLIL